VSHILGTSSCRLVVGTHRLYYLICRMQLFYTYLMHRECTICVIIGTEVQNCTFLHTNWLFSMKFGITGYYNPGQLQHMQVAKAPTYPAMYPVMFLFCELFNHNPPVLQTDRRQTERCALSISVTCAACNIACRACSSPMFCNSPNMHY